MGGRLHKLIENIKKDKKRSLLMLVLLGVLLLVIVWPVSDQDPDADAQTEKQDPVLLENGHSGQEQKDSGMANHLYGEALSSGQTLEAYVAESEERLTKLLSSIEGAGDVRVMITARATREKVIGKDIDTSASKVTENDSSGGTRVTDESSYGESALYEPASSGQGEGEPYVIKELVPEIEGVVIAAKGAGDEFIVDEITQAVSVLFDLPVHKIKVVKMES